VKEPRDLTVRLDGGGSTTAILYTATDASHRAALVLGHGAGAGQRSRFMTDYAVGLAGLGIDTITFNFPYTEEGRRLPDRAPVLESCYRSVVSAVRTLVGSAGGGLFIGGKSMGGRIATQVAAADPSLSIAGIVLIGYPLHPPGRPENRRDAHLRAITRPMLFVQGDRDTFGTPAELTPVLGLLTPLPALHVVARGDHSLKVPGATAGQQAQIHAAVHRTIADWIRKVSVLPADAAR
jgi:hypothetical protein